jgi:hypothetical protein
MSFPLSFPNINNGSSVLSQHQVIINIKTDSLVGSLSDGQYDCFDVFDLEVDRYEPIVVLFINVNNNLVAISAGSDTDYLMQWYFSFDSVGDDRIG